MYFCYPFCLLYVPKPHPKMEFKLHKGSCICLFCSLLYLDWQESCCYSVTQSCPTLCDPMDCNMPGFPVLHHLLEFAQTQCPFSRRCHLTSSSSVTPSSSCPQSFPASGSFPMSWLFTSGGQSIGASVSASVLPMNQGWFPLGLTSLSSLLSKGLKSLLQHHG